MKKRKRQSKETEIRHLLRSGTRLVVAIDGKGVHFRETLCVIHHGETGEAHYHTRPIGSLKSPRSFRKLVQGWTFSQ